MKRRGWAPVIVALIFAGGGGSGRLLAQETTTARTRPTEYVFNIVDWDGGQLPPLYERSRQPPLSLDDILAFQAAGFADSAVVKLIRQRRCACDVSVQSLVFLKDRGLPPPVLQAMSLHALPPNHQLHLVLQLDFEGLAGELQGAVHARRAYLYLIIPDGERQRVVSGNLDTVLAGRWQRDTLLDRTDLLVPTKVRRVTFAARIPLKVPGRKRALVFTSTRPDIFTVSDIPAADRRAAMEFAFDYPPSSLRQECSLQVLQRRDAMLADTWHLERAHFQCEWN